MRDILTPASLNNAMVTHAAFGGSTNLIVHLPAIAFSAGLTRPTVDDWTRINRQVPRLVDALPNGPRMHPTVQVFLAGGVPEVMLHLRRAGLLDTAARTVCGRHSGRDRSIGGSSPSGAPNCAACCANATAWTPAWSSWTRIPRAAAASLPP